MGILGFQLVEHKEDVGEHACHPESTPLQEPRRSLPVTETEPARNRHLYGLIPPNHHENSSYSLIFRGTSILRVFFDRLTDRVCRAL